MNSLHKLFLVVLLLLLPFAAFASEPEPPASPGDYVVDLAGVLDGKTKSGLSALLRELEEKTTAQVVVLTVKNLQGESIEGFSISMVEKWKLGQKGKDNGALIAISLDDRKYRFEVGYGLEGALPDSLSGSIGREYLVPNFKRGDYATGISLASIEIARLIAKSHGVELDGLKTARAGRKGTSGKKLIMLVLVFIILGLFSILSGKASMVRGRGGRGHGGGWYGGGFGGFGGGGFGGGGGGFGGGGGSFGGGGASGGW
ncbi:MAG: TPM domain-containing protein [Deltaproteobacteria bacterium]|nr:TPM domain-containing protein [Deltaproteobacteria bacterium]